MWEIGRRMKLQARKFFSSLNLDIIKYIMYNEAILKEVSRCKENERKELILAINKRFLSNLNLRNIVADELIEKVKILPNSNTIGWMTAYGNILNIIVNNKWKQKDMEGKTGNLINDNWNSKINVAPNYDATLPKMDIQIINNYFNINANKEISTIDGNNGNNVINTGKYNNMPNYIIDNMNTKQVEKFNIAAQEKPIKEFSIINKNKLAEKSISEILNIMASQQAVMKPIIGTIIPIQIKLKSNHVGIKTNLYIDKFWKEWNVNCNICYKIMWILKLLKDINVKEIKLLVEKYSIYAIYTKFRIIGLNIDTMECTNENIWEIIYIKDKIKIHLKLKMEYDLFQMEEMKIQLMVLIIQNKYQVIQQMDYYGKDVQENLKWLVNKEYIKIKIQVYLLQIEYGLLK
jgi:hypothetical protein